MGRVRYLISGMIVALAFLIPSMIGDAYAEATISSCGTLSMPGETYVLSKDITTSETCFEFAANGITLDGNGHSITGPGTEQTTNNIGVIVRGTTGVTVKNINISEFGQGISVIASDTSLINNSITNTHTGISVSSSCGVTLIGNNVNSNTYHGMQIGYSTGVTVTGNTANDNGDGGITIQDSPGSVLTGNTALSDKPGGRGISINNNSHDSFLIENTVSGNEAISLFRSNGNTLINNTVESCSNCNRLYSIGVTGIMIWESNGNTISKNNVDSTHLWGIYLKDSNDNTITGNVISNHKKEIASNAMALQIINSDNNTFNYNTISNNERPYTITLSSNNMIYNNNFIANFKEGLIYDDVSSNIFNLDLPIGGNYWDNFDEATEGCEDLNNDNICDSPFIDAMDAFAWSVPDGWLVNSPTIPDVDSLNIPEAAYCPNSEPEPGIIPEPEPEIIPDDFDVIENHHNLICHIPPGNEDNPQTILIANNAILAHEEHYEDHVGSCTESELGIQEVSLLTDNELLNDAIGILRTVRENLNSDTDVEYSISQAAQLHKLFTHEDKTTKKAFQSVFNQFNKDVKAFYGDTQVVSEKFILHELDKTALKLQIQISKAEKEEQFKNKIQSAIQFVNAQKELQKIKNQIGIEKLKFEEDNENLEALKAFEFILLKQTLIFTAKSDGEKITPELLKSIQKWAEEEIEENHNDGNGNSGDSNAGGNSDKGGGNSGKGGGNSGKGGGNSGKGGGNSGKGKGN